MSAGSIDLTALTPGARRILDVASGLFYARGIHAVGVDAIAAESGVTKRTLYDRFGSKDALVAAYLQDRHNAWWKQLEDRLAQAPRPRVRAVFEAYAQESPPADRGCAFLNAAAELPADHPGYRIVQEHKRAVRTLLSELLSEEALADRERLTDHLLLLLEGSIAHRGIDGDDRLARMAMEIAQDLVGVAPTV